MTDSKRKGMNFYHDVVDWVGGYPYEYISAVEVSNLLKSQDFAEVPFFPALVPTGNNEFVFKKILENLNSIACELLRGAIYCPINANCPGKADNG